MYLYIYRAWQNMTSQSEGQKVIQGHVCEVNKGRPEVSQVDTGVTQAIIVFGLLFGLIGPGMGF